MPKSHRLEAYPTAYFAIFAAAMQKDIFEITYEGTDYRFHMNGKSPMKWLMFVRYLNGFEEIEKLGLL